MQTRFGARLRTARKAVGWSQEDLSNATGISRNSLSDMELGKVNASLDTVRRVAEAIGVTMAELMPDYPTE